MSPGSISYNSVMAACAKVRSTSGSGGDLEIPRRYGGGSDGSDDFRLSILGKILRDSKAVPKFSAGS